MNVLKQLFNILSWPVYLCIAGYLLIAAPMLAGYRPVVVLSGSMEPTFPVGSVILVIGILLDFICPGKKREEKA